jgi:hypothetical protein
MAADPAELRQVVEHLCSLERESASEGERRAAEWIAGELRALGLEPRVETERVHGTFWWPIGIFSAAGAVAGLLRRRVPGTLLGLAAFAGVWEELQIRPHRTRGLLPKRSTYNVVAEAGERDAPLTVVVSSHHDAPHSSVVMDPAPTRQLLERHPWISETLRTWPRVMAPVVLGPALVAAGHALGLRRVRRFGTALSAAAAAAMADMGARPVVPGANDNASAVAAVLGLARELTERPVRGVRVILLSTGSEESLEEGMWAFVRRHEHELPRGRTKYLVVEMVGSPRLVVPEGEGFVYEHPYDDALKDLLSAAAADAGIEAIRGHGVAFSSDASVPINRGEPVAVLGSYDHLRLPVAYHWPDDTPDKLDYDAIARAVRVLDGAVRRLSDEARAPA